MAIERDSFCANLEARVIPAVPPPMTFCVLLSADAACRDGDMISYQHSHRLRLGQVYRMRLSAAGSEFCYYSRHYQTDYMIVKGKTDEQ